MPERKTFSGKIPISNISGLAISEIRNKFEFQIKKAQTDFAQGLGDLTKNNLINRLHLPIQVILSGLNQNNSFQTCVDSFWHLIYVFKFEVQRSLKKDTL